MPEKVKEEGKKLVKTGHLGYEVTEQRNTEMGQQSLLFQAYFPKMTDGVVPQHRFL